MAEQPPGFQFDDVPLHEARRMGRGPRMEPMLYDTLRKKIESHSTGFRGGACEARTECLLR
jgi:hypothetical protein